MSYEDRRGVGDQSELRRVLPQKFFGAFAINTEGELPGDGQTEREFAVAKNVGRVEIRYYLADELSTGDEREERERADALAFDYGFERVVYFSQVNIVNANRLQISFVCLPRRMAFNGVAITVGQTAPAGKPHHAGVVQEQDRSAVAPQGAENRVQRRGIYVVERLG